MFTIEPDPQFRGSSFEEGFREAKVHRGGLEMSVAKRTIRKNKGY